MWRDSSNMSVLKHKYSEEDGRAYIETVQDVQPIIDDNKRAMVDNRHAKFNRPMNKVASIPLVIIEQYWNEHKIDLMNDEAALRQFLNDPENRAWRTMGGNV